MPVIAAIRCTATVRLFCLTALALGLAGGAAHARQGAAKPAAGATSEKELLATFQKAFADKNEAKRVAALTAFGDATRALSDKGVGKKVTQALAQALADDEAEVRAAALGQLCYGRDVDVTLPALDAFLRAEYERVDRALCGTDPASVDRVSRGTVLYRNACFALGTYKDDRSVASLIAGLRSMHAITKDNDLATHMVDALAQGALAQGSLEAVEAVVKATKTFTGPLQEPAARGLNAALAEFATRAGTAPPSTSDSAAWQAWIEVNKEKFPKKLGHLATPPMEGPLRGLEGLPGKSG